jgi:two-component system chemotaxis response regulator CheB
VVQHRSYLSGTSLASALQRRTQLRVREPHDKEPVEPGRVYLAPADYHLSVDGEAFALSTGPPVCYARPSIDVLFEAVADVYGAGVIGVVLTGTNNDGASGAVKIKEQGGLVVVQDPATAEAPAMPAAVLAATPVDRVLPLPEIASFLTTLCAAPKQ